MMIDWVSPPAGMRPLSLIRPSAWPVRAALRSIQVFSQAQVAAFTTTVINNMTTTQLGDFTSTQMGALSASALGATGYTYGAAPNVQAAGLQTAGSSAVGNIPAITGATGTGDLVDLSTGGGVSTTSFNAWRTGLSGSNQTALSGTTTSITAFNAELTSLGGTFQLKSSTAQDTAGFNTTELQSLTAGLAGLSAAQLGQVSTNVLGAMQPSLAICRQRSSACPAAIC